MNTLLWALVFAGAFEVVASLYWLANGRIPERTPSSVAINACLMGAIGTWSLILLLRSAS